MIPEKESIVKSVQNNCLSESRKGDQVISFTKSFTGREIVTGAGLFLALLGTKWVRCAFSCHPVEFCKLFQVVALSFTFAQGYFPVFFKRGGGFLI